MPVHQNNIRGRGAATNPLNRFETISIDFDEPDGQKNELKSTQYFKDSSKTFITYNDSPDVGFDASINPYRGCEHGCIYCYARPTHEYLGLSAGLDFESKIFIKENGPKILEKELSRPKWKPQVLGISGVTDPYQPIERHFKLTRRCLEVLAKFKNPVVIITKNHMVTRDLDLLRELSSINAALVMVSITTQNRGLTQIMEPRTSIPSRRFEAIEKLTAAGIKTGILAAPIIPGLTDHEIPSIVKMAADAGAVCAGYVMLRLPYAVAPLFENWLERHYPDRKDKVLNRIRDIRGGKLNDPQLGTRMRGEGVFADEIRNLFDLSCRKAGLNREKPNLTAHHFRVPTDKQLDFFS